jgi:hypothetical protein
MPRHLTRAILCPFQRFYIENMETLNSLDIYLCGVHHWLLYFSKDFFALCFIQNSYTPTFWCNFNRVGLIPRFSFYVCLLNRSFYLYSLISLALFNCLCLLCAPFYVCLLPFGGCRPALPAPGMTTAVCRVSGQKRAFWLSVGRRLFLSLDLCSPLCFVPGETAFTAWFDNTVDHGQKLSRNGGYLAK